MKLLLVLIPIMLISIPFAYADYLNLDNATLKGDISNLDAVIVLQFGDNHEQELYSKTIITPTLDYGVIKIFDKLYTLDNSYVNIMGQSFTLKSFGNNYMITIYAENLGNNNFEVRVYIFEDESRLKFTFDSILN